MVGHSLLDFALYITTISFDNFAINSRGSSFKVVAFGILHSSKILSKNSLALSLVPINSLISLSLLSEPFSPIHLPFGFIISFILFKISLFVLIIGQFKFSTAFSILLTTDCSRETRLASWLTAAMAFSTFSTPFCAVKPATSAVSFPKSPSFCKRFGVFCIALNKIFFEAFITGIVTFLVINKSNATSPTYIT